MLSRILRKLAETFKGRTTEEFSVNKQEKYLAKFREPRNDIERSYFQYKAQMKLKGFLLSLIVNMVSIPLFFVYFLKPSRKIEEKISKDAVFVKDGGVNDNILPTVLADEFVNMETQAKDGNRLTRNDRRFILKLLLKYPLSWHFALKSEMKIARYRWFIDLYAPKALIVHNEYSFTSSLLTKFCNENQVELINVMHGEKLYYMGDSFFRFNRCYVWNEFYKNLLCELRADKEQFVIAIPPALTFNLEGVEKETDYTYYLQSPRVNRLDDVVEQVKKLANKGNRVAIRPHPRFTNVEELKKLLSNSGIEIENFREISIEKSILRTKNVISVYSTVLLQAHFNGVSVVIDDLSNPQMIDDLIETKYCMLNEEHTRLSELMNERVAAYS